MQVGETVSERPASRSSSPSIRWEARHVTRPGISTRRSPALPVGALALLRAGSSSLPPASAEVRRVLFAPALLPHELRARRRVGNLDGIPPHLSSRARSSGADAIPTNGGRQSAVPVLPSRALEAGGPLPVRCGCGVDRAGCRCREPAESPCRDDRRSAGGHARRHASDEGELRRRDPHWHSDDAELLSLPCFRAHRRVRAPPRRRHERRTAPSCHARPSRSDRGSKRRATTPVS